MSILGNEIRISNGSIIRVILWILFFVAIYYFRSIVFVLFLAIILASVVDRLVVFFKRYKIPRSVTVVSFYLISLTLLLLSFYFFLPTLVGYVIDTIKRLPEFFSNLNSSSNQFLKSTSYADFSNFALNLDSNTFLEYVKSKIFDGTGFIAGASSFINFLINFTLTIVISFYIAINERGVHNFLRLISPRKHENYIENLFERSERKISNWFIGQIVSAFFISILVYLVLIILGIPFSFSIALLAFVGELMPMVGMVASSIVALFLAWNMGGFSLMVITLVCFFLISQISSYLIYPKIVEKFAGVPTVVIIISVVMGATVAGFWGALIAIPVSTIVMEILDDYKKKKEDEQFILY